MDAELALLAGGLLVVGLFAGLIGGLFGIGGGIVIVPALYAIFHVLDVPDAVNIKLAVGTSLSTILITSWRSLKTHADHGAVDFDILKSWAPWIAAGAAGGAVAARFLSADVLTLVFALGALAVALRRALGGEPEERPDREMPTGLARDALGAGTGFVSALMGIGGGVLGVMMMTGFGRPIHRAIATASGFGLAIAVPGTIGFILAGLGAEGAPPLSVGYVNLAAFALIALMTAVTAPVGARLAHRLDKQLLSRVFAVYLALTAVLLLRDVLAG